MRYRRHDPSPDAPIDPNEVMELWLGPSHNGSLFRDREELQRAWELARDYMLKTFGQPGRRPRAFYAFEWDGPPPPYDRERSTLWRAGALDPAEKAVIEREWRREFEQAFEEDFSVAITPDEILAGVAARRAHWDWADIPDELLTQWQAERRQRRRRKADSSSTVETDPESVSAGETA
jgi:hypothetical protein